MSKLDAANCPIVRVGVMHPAQNDACNRHNRPMSSQTQNIRAHVPSNQYAGGIYMRHRYHSAVHRRSASAPRRDKQQRGSCSAKKRVSGKMGRIMKRDGIPCLFRALFFWAGHYYLKHGSDAAAAMCPSLRGSVLLSGTDRHGPEISTRASSTERGFSLGTVLALRQIAQSALQFSAGVPLWIRSKRV